MYFTQGSLGLVVVTTQDETSTYRRRRGHWLRVARIRAGLTLKEVAAEMGYSQRSQTTIKMWEDGKRDLSDVQLRKLAGVLNVPIEVFNDLDPTDAERLERKIQSILAAKARGGLRAS